MNGTPKVAHSPMTATELYGRLTDALPDEVLSPSTGIGAANMLLGSMIANSVSSLKDKVYRSHVISQMKQKAFDELQEHIDGVLKILDEDAVPKIEMPLSPVVH